MKIGNLHIITDKKLKSITDKSLQESLKDYKNKQELDNKITANLLHENTILKAKLGIIDE